MKISYKGRKEKKPTPSLENTSVSISVRTIDGKLERFMFFDVKTSKM